MPRVLGRKAASSPLSVRDSLAAQAAVRSGVEIPLLQQSYSVLHDFEEGRNANHGRYNQNGDDES